jgi:hypothetical protein
VSTHRWIPHAFMQARTSPLRESPQRQRVEPLTRAAHGILILACVLGALGADAAASGHGSADHARGQEPAGGVHLTASVDKVSSGLITPLPWMY